MGLSALLPRTLIVNEQFTEFESFEGYLKNKLYYIAYLNTKNEICYTTTKIYKIESERFRSFNGRDITVIFNAKISIEDKTKKTFFGKVSHYFFGTKTIREFVPLQFIGQTPEEAIINFLNIMSSPKKELEELMKKLHTEFSEEYPDIYFDKIMTYNGLTHSMFPKYFDHINDAQELRKFK